MMPMQGCRCSFFSFCSEVNVSIQHSLHKVDRQMYKIYERREIYLPFFALALLLLLFTDVFENLVHYVMYLLTYAFIVLLTSFFSQSADAWIHNDNIYIKGFFLSFSHTEKHRQFEVNLHLETIKSKYIISALNSHRINRPYMLYYLCVRIFVYHMF